MTMQIPSALQTWLHHRGWEAVRCEVVSGGFTATLYRLHVQTDTGGQNLIYKQLLPSRAQEFQLYEKLLVHLPNYAPKLIGRIVSEHEQGILIEDVGRPLKAVYRDDQRTRQEQEQLLHATALWLAEMHIQLESPSQGWLHDGLLQLYPIESSLLWGQEAVEALKWLCERGIAGINDAAIVRIQSMTDQFYPNLPYWMKGRMTLTHGDPHLENVMWRCGELCLIDWEYACVAIPQRDLAILLQDILDDGSHRMVKHVYYSRLRNHGWDVDDGSFEDSFQACFFDNTCMMLGWEVYKYQTGHMDHRDLTTTVMTKLRWLRESFQKLQ